MPLLPAVVPAIPENRAEVVAARLARKIAPLFGVPWPEGPFGGRTWVSDYAKITLSEIARGAPLPTREQAARVGGPGDGSWRVVDRIGIADPHTALPNEIANATLNRFGPDTRAAAVLTAVNQLLSPVREGMDTALALIGGTRLPPRLLLVSWAGMVIEVFRSQPALVAAGVHARAIQQELVTVWRLPLAAGLDGFPLTRCEVAPDEPPRSPTSTPRSLEFADLTFAALRLAPASDLAVADEDADPAALAGRLRSTECVDLLLRRLLAAGTEAEASYLWMSERLPGQLAVEALMPPTPVVDRFVADTWRMLGVPDGASGPPAVLPEVPTGESLRAHPVITRRCVLIALLTMLRHVQNSPAGRDATRRAIVPVLAAVAEAARTGLDPDDPVAALTACRAADMIVQTLRPDGREDLTTPVADLIEGLTRCEDLLGRGLLDRGAAAEAISSACVELNAVAQNNAKDQAMDPVSLRERVRRSWATYHEALEMPLFTATAEPPDLSPLAAYHLHNYAAFLAGATDEADLEEGVALFRRLVIPAREQFFATTGHFLPLRHSLQVGSRATTRLSQAAGERGDVAAALAWAGLGRTWIHRALDAEETRRLLAAEPPTESASRFALLAAPALLQAIELDLPDPADDVERVASLVDLVGRWEAGTVGDTHHHARHDEVVALSARVAAIRTGRGD
jgi:hypothetical protein